MKHLILTFVGVSIASGVGMGGSINGSVAGSDGSIVNGGFVVAVLIPKGISEPGLAGQPFSADISPNGTFDLGPLGLGQYQLCAQSPLSSWLGSCEWGGEGTVATLTQDQSSITVSIVLAKGAPIKLRVTDSTGLLSANEGKTAGAHLLVGVAMPNMVFRLAAIVAQDTAGRTYQVVVPFNRSIGLTVGSAFFQLSDSTGHALPKFGNVLPVLVPAGQQPPTLALNVIGTAQP